MPQQVGRPAKEGKVDRKRNPRGRPPAIKPVDKVEVKGGGMSEQHAKFSMDVPCRIVIHWKEGDPRTDEVQCKSYSLAHGIMYLATKLGEEVIPVVNVRRFEVVRA